MTDPTQTRAEVERLCHVIIRHVADGATIWEKDHAAMIDTMRALRERAEAAEAERAEQWRQRREAEAARDTALAISDAARRAEAAAWNDAARICDELAIGYAGQRGAVFSLTEAARDIRALRRAAPTEGEA